MKNRVTEIFYSLQGEGYFTGRPAVFVRFSGCNLACPFCDTDHQHYTEYSDEEIVSAVLGHSTDFVVLTGGEPSLQITEQLIDLLHAQGKFVAIETNGTRPLPPNLDWVTCSPKEGCKVALKEADELKVVYQGQDVEAWRAAIRAKHCFLQPCSCRNTAETVAYVKQHPHWRLSLQTHKYIGIE